MRTRRFVGGDAETVALHCCKLLLEADVIDCTIQVMVTLREALRKIGAVKPASELASYLLRLESESIREALHKHELPITNAIIARKNAILTASGIEVPEGHEVIDVTKYGDYRW